MEEEFGIAPDRLPIKLAPTIVHGNALTVDWGQVLPVSADVIVVGNPPFLGPHSRSDEQLAELRAVWRRKDLGRLDYVTGWHAKALRYFGSTDGRWAFVSTNSIVQGDQVPRLFSAIFNVGWRIKFAHRTFGWTSEATGQAAVHCVIVGYTRSRTETPRLFDYETVKSAPREIAVQNINAYLVDGPDVLVEKRNAPIAPDLARVALGSMPKDGGNLVVEPEDYPAVMADSVAAKYVHPYKGTTELIYDADRWCLWLDGMNPSDAERSPVLRQRIDGVRAFRLASKAPSTRNYAKIPHLFTQRAKRDQRYLCIPQAVSEHRRYFTADWLEPDVIASNLVFTVDDPHGFQFAIISSSMFLTWQRTVGGRMKSDLRFSSTMVWNTLPLPAVSAALRAAIVSAGKDVMAARMEHPERSLTEHYKVDRMEPQLLAAHEQLDEVVDEAFGSAIACPSERERQAVLFARYQEMTADPLLDRPRGRRG